MCEREIERERGKRERERDSEREREIERECVCVCVGGGVLRHIAYSFSIFFYSRPRLTFPPNHS